MNKLKYKQLHQVCKYVNTKIDISKVNLYNYISTENMMQDKGGVTIATTIPNAKNVSSFKCHDILTSNIRPYFKKIWFATKDGGCSNDVLVLRVNKNEDSRFLYYVLSDNNFFNYATVTSKGTKMPRGSKTAIMKYLVPDILLPTQKKVADILSAYDELIENNNRRIELLEKAAENLYKEWFVRFRFPNYKEIKFEKGLPQGWNVMKLGDVVEIIDGDRGSNYPKQEEFFDEGYCLFLNTSNVTQIGFNFSSNSFISKEKDGKLRKGKLQRNDIIMTTRGTVGNVALYSGFIKYNNIRINSGMVIIRQIVKEIPIDFLYAVLRSENMKKSIMLYSSGSAQPQLPIKDMRKLKLILPSNNLIERYNNKVQNINLLISNIQTQNLNLIKQSDLLLPRLMSGKLEVSSET